MRLIILEGTHATGTTTQADAVALALRAHGIEARAFHHARETGDVVTAARGYAAQRARLHATARTDEVIVADRWTHSTWAESAVGPHAHAWPLAIVSRSEIALPAPLLIVMLNAPDAVLDARTRARGEEVAPLDPDRRHAYRHTTWWDYLLPCAVAHSAPVVRLDTGALSVEETTAAIVARALEVLR